MPSQGEEFISTENADPKNVDFHTKEVQSVDDHLIIEFTEIKKEQTEYFENNMYNLQNQR